MPRWGRKALGALLLVGLLAISEQAAAAVFRVVSGRLHEQEHLLVAGPRGAQVWLAPGITMRIAPGAEMARVNKGVKLWLSNDGRTPTRMIALRRGRIDIESKPGTKHAVLVRAPFEVAAIADGANLTVIATLDQTSIVNHQGRVYTSVGPTRLRPLEESRLQHVSDQGVRHTHVLPAPSVQLSETLLAAFGGSTPVRGVSWSEVPEAEHYQLTVFETEKTNESVAQVVSRGTTLEELPQVPAGLYAISARAVDAYGIAGAPSEPVSFKVLGLELTNGGYVDSRGRIVAGYDRQVRFRYADGLLMKQGKRGPWIATPDQVTLDSSEPTQFHLRKPGDSRLVSTRVFPQPAHAVVEIGPKLLTWPGANAEVSVQIVGAPGEQSPGWIEPRMRVTLGIDELQVDWSKTSQGYVAQIPPQGGPGPWVLRVEVEDQWGHPLGRDFVEITRSKEAPLPLPKPSMDRVSRSD